MVSFIILNYNTSKLTLECVRSIRENVKAMPNEIIVVDNASSKEELSLLKEGLSADDNLIVSRRNSGYGYGNMLGANFAHGDYICILNSDVRLLEDCVTPLCQYLEEHEEVGCVSPQQYNAKGEPVSSFKHRLGIRHDLIGDSIFERFFPHQFPRMGRYVYDRPFEVPEINGCFMLFPTNKFWSVGGFDTNIFLYYEEYDLGIRLREKGWKCMVYPMCKFQHLHAVSTSKIKSSTTRERYLSKMYSYSKHHGLILSTIYKIINIVKLSTNPHKWYILPTLVRGDVLSRSMRHNMR
jgi:GT2 family glycosyltransferase